MNTHQHPNDPANSPDIADPDRSDQTPGKIPGKEAPARHPMPDRPREPGQDEPGRQTPPGGPGKTPPITAG